VEPFFAQILSGMQATLSAQSIALHLLVVEDADAEIDTYRRWTSERRVDGVVMVDVWARDPRRAVLKQLPVPSVVHGGPGRHGLSSVWVDDRAAMSSIADCLAALGHRRIARCCPDPGARPRSSTTVT
jgi:DNA-binding LacI/PurR family transcriptional regulator